MFEIPFFFFYRGKKTDFSECKLIARKYMYYRLMNSVCKIWSEVDEINNEYMYKTVSL